MSERHLDFAELRAASHDLAAKRRQAIKDRNLHVEKALAAEREFHKQKAIATTMHRSEGKGFGESEILANKDTADIRYERDIAQALAKSDLLLIEALEREQATLRQLGDWSKELETIG